MIKADAAQDAAIKHREGPALTLAGPGSGKTFVITRRLEYLINHCHIEPSSILTITYTKAAAGEMKKRAEILLGSCAGAMTIGTFHSVFYSVLRHRFPVNSPRVLKAREKFMILADIARELHIDTRDMHDTADELQTLISRSKNGLDIQGGFGEELDEKIVSLYSKRLKELCLIDFDDMILKCRSLFEKDPGCLESWQRKYRYIQIDEMQDINRIQYDTVRALAGDSANIFGVGDDDQAIYGFRGAEPGMLQHFLDDYPEAALYELAVNYRCSAPISEAADRVIAKNKDRLVKHHTAFNRTGEEVDIRSFKGRTEEISEVIRSVKTESAGSCAILVRTNELASFFAGELERAGIPVHYRGKRKSRYASETAKDVTAYLRLASGDYGRSELLRVMNRPMRFISREAFSEEGAVVEDAVSFCRGAGEAYNNAVRFAEDVRMMGRMKPKAALRYLMKVTGYESFLKEEGRDKTELKELYDISSGYMSIRQWLDAIDEEMEASEVSGPSPHDDKDGVSVLTLHASKGLEFHEVFILDVNEDGIPSHRASLPEELEEERRLFYVGMTRAAAKLHLFGMDLGDEV